MTLISKVLTYATSNLSRETQDMIKKLQRLLGRSQNVGEGRGLTTRRSLRLDERACLPTNPAKKAQAGCRMSGGLGGRNSHHAKTSPSPAGAGKIHLFYLNAH